MVRANTPAPREDDRILRYAAVIFAVALVVHGADHFRRGTDLLTTEVFWAGNIQTVGAIATLALVFTRNRWAPVAAVIIGFASAFGFAVVHLLPDWGVFSDAFPGAHAGADVTAFSWFAALFEIGADLALGLAGARVLHLRRSASSPHATGAGSELEPVA